MTSNDAAVPTEFSWSMRVLTLTRIDQVDLWATQVEEMAKACGSYREMTTRFGAFPKPGTVEAFICQTRYAACWRILTETISGPVWAYMRALGYSKIPLFRGADGIQWQPAPVDAFYYAKQAGYRLSNPGGPSQSREEIMRMVEELRVGQPADYPSQSQFVKGHHWMKEVLDSMIRKGDRQVCDSLYDTPPMFAPIWIGPPRPEEYRWNLPGAPLHGQTQKPHPSVEVHLAQQRQQQLAEREQQWIRMDESQRSGQYTVIPSNMAPPPTPPPPARALLPEQPQPGQYHSHPQPPPVPGPGPGPYVQQPPPPPPPGQGLAQGQYVSPYGPVGHPPHPPQQDQQQQQYARPPTVPSQAPPPQVQGQGAPPPQPQTHQEQGPPQNMNRQIPQQAPTPTQQAQPTEVITIPDRPISIETPQDMSTPPPLFTGEEENADDNDGDGNDDKSDDGGGGAGGNAHTQEGQEQQQQHKPDKTEVGGGEEGEEGEDEDEQEEETFHDAEEGNNGSGNDDGENGDGDVVMADGGDDSGQAIGDTPGGEAGEEDSEEGDGEEGKSEEE